MELVEIFDKNLLEITHKVPGVANLIVDYCNLPERLIQVSGKYKK